MLSITSGSDQRSGPTRSRRPGVPLAVSLTVNAVVIAAFFRAVTGGVDWSALWHPGRSAEVRPERIGFVQLPTPAPPTVGRDGGDGRPKSATPSRRATPQPAAPTEVPTGIPPVGDPTPADARGSGEIVGSGGATEGIRPSYTDPRLWTRPGAVATAPRTAKERIDSVIADQFTPVRDSILAAQALAAGQRAPGDWTMKGPGGKWGMDQSNIHLGKVKIPNAVLALLSGNLQKNLRGNPTEMMNDRRLAEVRADLLRHADREMSEDAFRKAVKEVRARKDRERAERRKARDQQPPIAEASGETRPGSGTAPQR
ncbi:hypothetical protein [Roseisolibacter agri]|uniref:Uncharacterized protein n=1 Tax=Roseisolibacter agri TaxID=2014610 RepID=A0AA37VBF6_9BACT|nr:hypothetical protein [Roseisolibacter agri]GLC26383.1 hypothetical protein rosag_28960 [Roseisolibacter agri]